MAGEWADLKFKAKFGVLALCWETAFGKYDFFIIITAAINEVSGLFQGLLVNSGNDPGLCQYFIEVCGREYRRTAGLWLQNQACLHAVVGNLDKRLYTDQQKCRIIFLVNETDARIAGCIGDKLVGVCIQGDVFAGFQGRRQETFLF